MQKEIYLFILWQNARRFENEILTQIKKNFKIITTYEVTWTATNFAQNLARFYGKKLPKGCRKEKETGNGSFLCLIIHDPMPCYESDININVVRCKKQFRELVGGNFIHASDNPQETNENLLFLFGKTADEFQYNCNQDTLQIHKADLVGCPAWENIEQALSIIKKVPFTHIKVYKESYLIHSRYANLICRLLNASSRFSLPGIHKYSVPVGKSQKILYIRQTK